MSLGFQLCSAARRARRPAPPVGVCPGAPRGAALRVLLRVLFVQLMPAAWLLFSASTASALPVDSAAGEPAPMCDPDGASVAAQDEIPEIDHGRFEALPCEAQLLLSGWKLDAPELGRKAARCGGAEQPVPADHADAPRPRSEGACQPGVPFPARSEPMRVEYGGLPGLGASRGHARVPFRPPVVVLGLGSPAARV